MECSQAIAKILLKEKGVFLRPQEPFTWTSGIKSPVYCDNRLLISTVDSRQTIIDAFVAEVKKLGVDLIAGTATAGIPWAAWIALELRLPLVYVRSSTKEHGRQNAIEGAAKTGQKAVLIEDLISTGKSSISAAKKLEESGVKITTVLSIFSYNFDQVHETFKTHGLSFSPLSTFDVLAKVAYDEKVLDEQALMEVLNWRKSVVLP